MADVKFSGLPAVTPPIDKDSLVAWSTDDGGGGLTSEKVTLTQSRAAHYLMEAEQKITFDDTGSNAIVINAVDNIAALIMTVDDSDGTMGFSGNSSANFNQGVCKVEENQGFVGHNAASLTGFHGDATTSSMQTQGTTRISANSTGLGFFNTTPVAQPTGVAVSSSGIHAALVSLGLITA